MISNHEEDRLTSTLDDLYYRIIEHIFEGGDEQERAELIEEFRKTAMEFMDKYPESTSPYEETILLYLDLEWIDQAEETIDIALSKFPESEVINAYSLCFHEMKANLEELKKHLEDGELLSEELSFRVELTVQHQNNLRKFEIIKKKHPSDLTITVTIDGVTVKGEITYLAPNDINVEITSPHKGISSGWHVPYFAMASRKNWNMIDDRLTKKGKRTAEKTLVEIYRACEAFSKHGKEIKAKREELLKKARDKYEFESEYHEYLSDTFGISSLRLIEQLEERFLNIRSIT